MSTTAESPGEILEPDWLDWGSEASIAKAVQDFTFAIGDVEITVTVNGTQIVGKVCADAMALASPAWNKFMYPPWNSSSGGTTKAGERRTPVSKVDFSQDDSDALLLLLRIVHYQFAKLPASLTEDELFDVAVLADKYHCHGLLHPWLANWIKVCDVPGADKESSLFVFWVFGDEERFSTTAKFLVGVARVKTTGEYVTTAGHGFPEPSPPHIIENILAKRLATIKALLAIPYNTMDRFGNINGTSSISNVHNSQPGGHGFCPVAECDAILYGSLQLSLQRQSLWPRKQPSDILNSPKELGATIAELSIYSLPPSSQRYSNESHYSCKFFNYPNLVGEIMKDIESPVCQVLLEHMKTQRINFK